MNAHILCHVFEEILSLDAFNTFTVIVAFFFVLFATVAQMFAQKYGLARLSIGSVMRMVLNTHQHTELAAQMKSYLFRGLTVPDELAVQCLEVAFLSLICNTRG